MHTRGCPAGRHLAAANNQAPPLPSSPATAASLTHPRSTAAAHPGMGASACTGARRSRTDRPSELQLPPELQQHRRRQQQTATAHNISSRDCGSKQPTESAYFLHRPAAINLLGPLPTAGNRPNCMQPSTMAATLVAWKQTSDLTWHCAAGEVQQVLQLCPDSPPAGAPPASPSLPLVAPGSRP
jgi:hypothetical protein